MLLEIHLLQNHAPSNLNRDDTGSPKDCIFGGVRRSRISSQCLKRSIRTSKIFEDEMKGIGIGIRTRWLPAMIKEKLKEEGIEEELAEAAAKKSSGFGTKAGKEREDNRTAQIMFFSQQEIEGVARLLKEKIEVLSSIDEVEKLNVKELQKELRTKFEEEKIIPVTPDVAFFGRMITSEAFNDIEASMQVAHAISTNKMDHEFDFFTAVDDKKGYGEDLEAQGAAMMGDIEFNSACYYKYFSLNVEDFLENITGGGDVSEHHKEVLKTTIKAFLNAAVFTTPSGKQNSFAAHQLPSVIYIEVKDKPIPISYANAFVNPCNPWGDKDLIQVSIEALTSHITTITNKYSLNSAKRLWFSIRDEPILENAEICKNFNDVIEKLEETIESGLK
ncbi:MAG: type I-E CRISPR-associated protein Cas7/Cse4/CasC [Candidatus Thorarchaeota archaeon]